MEKTPRVLITGASGFVGRELRSRLQARGTAVTAAVRFHSFGLVAGERTPGLEFEVVGDIGSDTDWTNALKGVDVVVHLAAQMGVMRGATANPMAVFREVNTQGTARLARMAAASGVTRLIFLSSVKVNGEMTESAPFSEDSQPSPQDFYAVSKWEAEQALHAVAGNTDLEFVVLRPPLVYGPGVRANFLRLLQWVDRGIPLPLAAVKNRRSLIYLGNLIDALITCIDHPAAANKTYLVSDGEDVPTPELICRMATALGKAPRLWPCPDFLLRTVGALTGKASEVDRLIGSLQVDGSRFCRELEWMPPFGMDEGLRQTVNWYRDIPR